MYWSIGLVVHITAEQQVLQREITLLWPRASFANVSGHMFFKLCSHGTALYACISSVLHRSLQVRYPSSTCKLLQLTAWNLRFTVFAEAAYQCFCQQSYRWLLINSGFDLAISHPIHIFFFHNCLIVVWDGKPGDVVASIPFDHLIFNQGQCWSVVLSMRNRGVHNDEYSQCRIRLYYCCQVKHWTRHCNTTQTQNLSSAQTLEVSLYDPTLKCQRKCTSTCQAHRQCWYFTTENNQN